MSQHKTNPNVAAVKRGELKAKAKAEKPLSKREADFLRLWAAAIARRSGDAPATVKDARTIRRRSKRITAAHLREINALAMQAIKARQKAARKQKAA